MSGMTDREFDVMDRLLAAMDMDLADMSRLLTEAVPHVTITFGGRKGRRSREEQHDEHVHVYHARQARIAEKALTTARAKPFIEAAQAKRERKAAKRRAALKSGGVH
jgi:hypothetical protein